MKYTLLLFFTFSLFLSLGQMSEDEIEKHRADHFNSLTDTAAHLLNEEEIAHFQGLDYFPFDDNYRIVATFTKDKGKRFEMPTSTARTPIYRRYGYLDFIIKGTKYRLEAYQNIDLRSDKEYRDYLFVPFRDKTSGKLTYGGGRYLDIRIPEGDTILLDFNLLYNPYCSYSYRYSCPIPPAVNTLDIEINAGEKTPKGH